MNLHQKFTRLTALVLIGFLSMNTINAQATTVKPNITADEFTAKGESFGFDQGSTVPNLNFNDVNSKKFNLYEMLEKPTVIEIFSLNSETNAKNKKYLASFYRQYDINIISICTDQYPNEIRLKSKAWGSTWSNVMDDNKKIGGMSFAEMFHIPTARFIVIYPDKQVAMLAKSEKEIGKVAVALQQYFN